MKPRISIIVPIYNTENYLPCCLDSLCRQTLREIEILLIDDSSSDYSGEICEKYAQRDSRIRVFHHKDNKGPGAARNLGIENATGDWLMFVDSDDWVHEDYCKAPYEYAISHQADLVMFGMTQVLKTGKKDYKVTIPPAGDKTKEEAIELIINNTVGNYSCNKLFKRTLFSTLRFPEKTFYEDIGTIYKTVWNAEHISCLDKTLYYYRRHSGSSTSKRSEKIFDDGAAMIKQQYHDLAAHGFSSQTLDMLLQNFALSYCIAKKRTHNITDSDYEFFANVLHACKKVPEKFTWKRKFLFVIFNYCPLGFEIVCSLCGKKFSA